MAKIPVDLLTIEPRIKEPRADDLIRLFGDFINYCKDNGYHATRLLWIAYLGIYRQLYDFWQVPNQNKYLDDAEFNDRLSVIKKIEILLESGMSEELMTADKPTGIIFALKNIYKWTDRPPEEKQVNINFGGYVPPKDSGKPTEKEEITEDL